MKSDSISSKSAWLELKDGSERENHKTNQEGKFAKRCIKLSPKLAFPMAVLAGTSITAGTTYVMVKHVQQLLAIAGINPDPNFWIQMAQTSGYDACYNSCNKCQDLNWSYNACQKTASAIVPGLNCSGTTMWNWLDRYPTECLQALGAIYKTEEIQAKKNHSSGQLALVILTILAGIVGACVTFILWRCAFPTRSLKQRPWASTPVSSPQHSQPPSRRRRRWPVFWHSVAVASLVGTPHAFPCWGYSSDSVRYFSNSNNTISGTVHGWTSDCSTTKVYNCGSTCTSNADNVLKCQPEDCTDTIENNPPAFFVNNTLDRVMACGFQLVDIVESDVTLRVANPQLERVHLVSISVNRYNLTDVTDRSVLCLWNIGNVEL